jgi:hypothetical protein
MSLDEKAANLCPLHRRRFLTASAALGAVVFMPGGSLAADVRELAGSVKVNGKAATRKTRVRPGDVVETGAKSKVVFVIGQDAFLLREQSRLNLNKPGAGKEAVIAGLRLVSGALLAVFGKGPHTIETATATAGIRGTGVYIEASANATYFCTCYGEVELRDKARTMRKLVVSGYHTPNMIFGQMVDGKMMVPAEVKDHTDDELIMLEKLVGRTSPVAERNQKSKGGEPTRPEAQSKPPAQPKAETPPKAEAPVKAEPAPQSEPPLQPQAAPKTVAPEPPPPSPTPPPEPPAPPKPETPPSDLEWRLPPPRLN